jgi:hypothetical protein
MNAVHVKTAGLCQSGFYPRPYKTKAVGSCSEPLFMSPIFPNMLW